MSEGFIGRYEIVSELGRGGMGVVYRAIDPTIKRTVALKTLRLDNQAEKPDEVLRRFKHEAELAGGMNHPNIVTIYDAGDHGDLFYIAMEFIEGKTLQAFLLEQRLPVGRIIEVSRQVCSALDYAHRRGVVHRDIKPANVMGASISNLKIMDFGIAKSDLGLTVPGQVLGTPAYMSPEQVMGRELDGRSDLFSFAVMLYEMATGEMPFSGKTATTIIYKIANETPIAPCDLDVTIHPGISGVISKALSKNPDDRFQTGSELVAALESYKSFNTAARKAISGPAMSSADSPTVTTLRPLTTQPLPAASARNIAAVKRPTAQRNSSTKMWTAVALLLIVGIAAAGAYLKRRSTVPNAVTMAPAVAETESPKPIPAPENAKPDEAAKAAPKFGELRITSNPSGAKVTINGKSEEGWTTPFTAKKLMAGSHTILFDKQDFVEKSVNSRVIAGEIEKTSANLTASGGTVTINSDPPGAHIIVDGTNTGKITPDQIHVDAGQHRIIVRKPGFRPENTTVEIKDGEQYPFSPTLDPANGAGKNGSNVGGQNGGGQLWLKKALQQGKGVIAIISSPPGATIQMNGRTLKKTTPLRAPIPPGDYQMTISMDGYRTMQRQFTIEAGKFTRLDLRMVPN